MDCGFRTGRGAVTVSALTVPGSDVPKAWRGVLSVEENSRVEAFQFRADRNSYIAAHALLRGRLSEVTGLAARELRFFYDEYGKPALDNGCGAVAFSLSHTQGMVAVAISNDAAVGVDVEAMSRPVADDVAIAEAHFAPNEVAALRGAPDGAARNELFVRFWTRKEAVLKATGRGLGLPLSAFSVAGDCDRTEIPAMRHEAPYGFALASRRFGDFDIAVAAALGNVIPPEFFWQAEASDVCGA